MDNVKVMVERIRDQVGALLKLKASGTLRVTVEMIPGLSAADPRIVEQQVRSVADCVTEIIQQDLGSKQDLSVKERHENRTENYTEGQPMN